MRRIQHAIAHQSQPMIARALRWRAAHGWEVRCAWRMNSIAYAQRSISCRVRADYYAPASKITRIDGWQKMITTSKMKRLALTMA